MTEKGWQVTANPDGSLSGEAPSEQYDQYEADKDQCSSDLGYDQPRPPINEEEAEEIWDQFLDAAECVRGLGFPVKDPPSRQFAVEEIQKDIVDLGWDPYEALSGLPEEEAFEVYEACPQPAL